MADKDHNGFNSDGMDDFLPREAQTDEQKIDTLLDLLASGFEGDPDLDLVRLLALHYLLQFRKLPQRTVEIMQAILADEDESDPALNRKMAAARLLGEIKADDE